MNYLPLFGFWNLLFSVFAVGTNNSLAAEAQIVQGEEGFALVELFSSQGCSSCPPADRL